MITGYLTICFNQSLSQFLKMLDSLSQNHIRDAQLWMSGSILILPFKLVQLPTQPVEMLNAQ